MPTKYVAPSTLNDVDKGQRKTLQALITERAFFGCTLSLAALVKAGVPLATIQKAVVASTDDEKKAVQKDVNDRITAILQENGLETIRTTDAFGNTKDCGWYQSKSVTFSKQAAIDAMLKRRISPDTIEEIVAEATKETPYTALTVKSVKDDIEKEEDHGKGNKADARSTASAGKGSSKRR